MKKILSLILAIMMMASVFAGCSENKEPEQNAEKPEETENEIVIEALQKSFTAIIYDEGENEEYWNSIKAGFETANPGITVNMIVSKDAAYEVRDRILSGNSPDFVYLPADEETGVTEALIKDRALLALSDVEESAPAGIFENSICKPYDDGISYIAPAFIEDIGLIFNTELLDSNGFSVPENWNDFVSIAKACENKKFKFFTYAGADPDEFVDIFAAALVPVIGAEEMNKILFCDEEAWNNEAIKTFIGKIEEIKSLVVSKSTTKSREDVIDCLKKGEALFVSGTAADLEELNKDGEKYALCGYPALSGSGIFSVTFSEMYIPFEAKEPQLAKDFMKFILEDHASENNYLPGSVFFSAEFSRKTGANETLSDEFCESVIDVFKSDSDAEEFVEQMLEYIEEY